MTDQPDFGDSEAKRIIERAAVLDAEQGRRLNAAALREIAAEAGISATAVDRALLEHSAPAKSRLSWIQRHPVLVSLAVLAAALLMIALLFATMRSLP
jgi:hypothetical protein